MKTRVMTNRFDGTCTECGQAVPAGSGDAYRHSNGKWWVRHTPARWVRPTGPWDKFEAYRVGGCPETSEAGK